MNRGGVVVRFLVSSVCGESLGVIMPFVVLMVMIVMMPLVVIRVVMVISFSQ
jgi:hypothetical protein